MAAALWSFAHKGLKGNVLQSSIETRSALFKPANISPKRSQPDASLLTMQPLLLFSLSLLSTFASASSPTRNLLTRQEHSNGCQLVLIVVPPVPPGWIPCGSPGYYLPEVDCICCSGVGGCNKDTQSCAPGGCYDYAAEGNSAAAPAASTVAAFSSTVAEPTSQAAATSTVAEPTGQAAATSTSESPAAIPTTESAATSSVAPAEFSTASSTIESPASSTQAAASPTSSNSAVSTGLLVWDMGWLACVTASVLVLMGIL
jgi:hypothetical protein